jgi:hypothetical protein
MVVKGLDQSLASLKGASVRVSNAGWYPEPGASTVELIFSDGTRLRADYWRIIKDGRADVSSFDHDQKYGLPVPINAFSVIEQRLQGQVVTEARFTLRTGDLNFQFEDDVELEVFNFTGYEVWEIHFPNGTGEYSPHAR